MRSLEELKRVAEEYFQGQERKWEHARARWHREEESGLWTVAHLAYHLRVSSSWIRQRIHEGRIRPKDHPKDERARYVIPWKEVERAERELPLPWNHGRSYADWEREWEELQQMIPSVTRSHPIYEEGEVQ